MPKGVRIYFGVLLLAWLTLCAVVTFPTGLLRAQNSKWFSVTIGETTCTGTKIEQTPIKVAYACTNPYGGTAGSYTAVGATAPNVFLIGLSSLPPAVNPSSVTCSIGMNATAFPVSAGSLGIIPPNSAIYSCSGLVGSTISWP